MKKFLPFLLSFIAVVLINDWKILIGVVLLIASWAIRDELND
jgi:hypothetical protein